MTYTDAYPSAVRERALRRAIASHGRTCRLRSGRERQTCARRIVSGCLCPCISESECIINGLVNDLLREVAGMEVKVDTQLFEDPRNSAGAEASFISRPLVKPRLGAHLPSRLRQSLIRVAGSGAPILYERLASLVVLASPNATWRLHKALAHLMMEDAENGRPFIAALVIGRSRGGLPSRGFFTLASRLGRFAGDMRGLDAWAFHAREFHAAVTYWSHR